MRCGQLAWRLILIRSDTRPCSQNKVMEDGRLMDPVLKYIQATVPVASASSPTFSLFKEEKAGMRKFSPEQKMPFGNHVGKAAVRARLLRQAKPLGMRLHQLFEAEALSREGNPRMCVQCHFLRGSQICVLSLQSTHTRCTEAVKQEIGW